MGRFSTGSFDLNDVERIAYTMEDVRKLLCLSESGICRLISKGEFPIVVAVRRKLIPIKPFNHWLSINHPQIYAKCSNNEISKIPIVKKSYSVPEVRRMLGIGKTSSYEFVKSGAVETIRVNQRLRITKSSFDKWFHSQDEKHNELTKKGGVQQWHL